MAPDAFSGSYKDRGTPVLCGPPTAVEGGRTKRLPIRGPAVKASRHHNSGCRGLLIMGCPARSVWLPRCASSGYIRKDPSRPRKPRVERDARSPPHPPAEHRGTLVSGPLWALKWTLIAKRGTFVSGPFMTCPKVVKMGPGGHGPIRRGEGKPDM